MMQAAPHDTLLVGDSVRRDIEPCTRLGIRTVYARYGDRFTDNRGDHGADFVIDNLTDLQGILASLNEIQGKKPE
jgi:putative hydrolase of the HAD superfamily